MNGTRAQARAQQTVEHREIGRKPSARRGQHALHEQAIQAARLRDARAARSLGAAGTPISSRTAAANALMRHKDWKPAAHGRPVPLPKLAFKRMHRRRQYAARSANEGAIEHHEEHVHRVGVPRSAAGRRLH